jgi:tetratricopeptide (TPR) repeat protein
MNKKINYTTYNQIIANVYKFDNVVLNANIKLNHSILYSQAMEKKNSGETEEAIELFNKYINSLVEDSSINVTATANKMYDAYINMALLTSINCEYNNVLDYYENAMNLCPDRAEPYLYFGIYCNQIHNFEKSYELLTVAKNMSYDNVKNKYNNVQEFAYGIYAVDELIVSCYWLKKYEEGFQYLTQIIDMPYFKSHRTRLDKNKEYFITKLQI